MLLGSAACSGGDDSPSPSDGAAPTLRPATPIPGVTDAVFSLGVASGDPLPDSVVLWTRLANEPLAGGGMPDRDVEVEWQVATDEAFSAVVAAGSSTARPALAHSVHIDVRGLEPATPYFYRFRAGTVISPVGRAKTAPAPGTSPELTFALASCQDYQNGYWPAHDAIAADELDLVVFVGDYIYEYDPGGELPDRHHTAPATVGLGQLTTLDDYRNRHAQYKTDPQLQAAHRASAWIATWDDHEVENNYAGLVDESGDTGAAASDPATFARQRAAAYQAYYEHMPIRVDYPPGSPDLRLYRRFGFGDLMTLNVLDTRQYRTPTPEGPLDGFGPAAVGASNVTGTMSGSEQESWLADGLRGSEARWNVIAQQTMMGRVRGQLPGGDGTILANLDQSDGYGPYRSRLLSTVASSGATNPVVLSGDIHCAWVNDLRIDFDQTESPVVATEFVSTSISSQFFLISNEFVRDSNARFNPHVRYFRGDRRGYTRIRVTPDEWRSEMRTVETIDRPDVPATTDATWVVENGRPGAQPA